MLITALAHSPHMHVEQVIDIQMTLEGMGSRRPFLEWSGERRQWVPGESSGRMHSFGAPLEVKSEEGAKGD